MKTKLFVTLLLILTLTNFTFSADKSPYKEIIILYTNASNGQLMAESVTEKDVKKGLPLKVGSRVGGYPSIATYIDQIRKEAKEKNKEVLVFDLGNSFFGTAESNFLKGKPAVEAMNYIGYDGMLLGNREFDFGIQILKILKKRAEFPFITTNLLNVYSKKHFDFTKPYIIKEFDNLKIGIIGVVTEKFNKIVYPLIAQKVKIESITQTLTNYAKMLKKDEGCDLVIALTHVLPNQDELSTKNIDVIINGHIGGMKYDKITDRVFGTIVAPIANSKHSIGRLDLTFNLVDKYVEEYKGDIVFLDNRKYRSNMKVMKILLSYIKQMKNLFKKEIGVFKTSLLHNRHNAETPLANFITDIMLNYSKADVAIINSDAIRSDIKKGKFTLKDLMSLLPFENHIVTLKLTGDQLLTILSRGLRSGHYLNLSGIHLNVAHKYIQKAKIGKFPINLERNYKVITIDFLASGGDGFSTFPKGKEIEYSDVKLRDIIEHYIKTQSPIKYIYTPRVIEK